MAIPIRHESCTFPLGCGKYQTFRAQSSPAAIPATAIAAPIICFRVKVVSGIGISQHLSSDTAPYCLESHGDGRYGDHPSSVVICFIVPLFMLDVSGPSERIVPVSIT